MREKARDRERLQHIIRAIDQLRESSQRHALAEVQADPVLFFGFVKLVEIIGEAVYMITPSFKATHPCVEWDAIEGMRHVLVHGYYMIRPKQLWDTIEQDLPQLRPAIEEFLQEEDLQG